MFLPIVILLVFCCTSSIIFVSGGGNFFQDFDEAWGDGRARMLDDGQLLTLSLDQTSGSSVQSRNEYLFGKFDMQLKLVPGNSAGTVSSFYLSSHGLIHDEIDFEFLGNLSGDPYVLHTNVFTSGGGGREQQFYLWFDPTADFHTYSIIWTPLRIIFSVDGTPIREFKNLELAGVPFANKQPMRVYASIWNAEYWATRGGRVRIDWTKAPFTASYRRFNDINACVWSSSAKSSSSNCTSNLFAEEEGEEEESDFMVEESLKWVEENYMIYNYCTDVKKYPRGLPAECVVTSSTKQNVVSI